MFLGGGEEGEKSARAKDAPQGLGSQIDPAFQPSPEAIDRCHEQGATDADIDSEVRKFIGHHQEKHSVLAQLERLMGEVVGRTGSRYKVNAPKAKVATPEAPDRLGRCSASRWVKLGRWPRGLGNDPESPACRAPPEVLAKHGIKPAALQ